MNLRSLNHSCCLWSSNICQGHRNTMETSEEIQGYQTCTLLEIVVKRYKDVGMKDIWIESGVLAEASMSGVLGGRKYNRSIRFHKLLYKARRRLAWKEFPSCCDQHHSDKNIILILLWLKYTHDARRLSDYIELRPSGSSMHCNSPVVWSIQVFLREKSGAVTSFWMSYLDMVDIVLNLLRTSREGDWMTWYLGTSAMTA